MSHTPVTSEKSFAAIAAAIICVGLLSSVLANGQVVTSPPANAATADKDAYVNARLAELFAGVPVHVALRLALDNGLVVDISTDRPGPAFSIILSGFDNERAARNNVQDELHFFKSSMSLTKAGFDEFYSDGDVRWIGRRGTSVVNLVSGPAAGFDAGFAALAQHLSINPELLPNLIRYAYSMHFGPTAPLHSALAKLADKLPELSRQSLVDPGHYGANSVESNFTDADGIKWMIIAKAYDSEATAKSGLELDQLQISVAPDKTEIVQGVKVYEYIRYGGIAFQRGFYTFRVNTTPSSNRDAQPLLLKIVSAVVEMIDVSH